MLLLTFIQFHFFGLLAEAKARPCAEALALPAKPGRHSQTLAVPRRCHAGPPGPGGWMPSLS